jgi:hypothetical protein
MEQSNDRAKFESPLARALEEFADLAREQVEAAWDVQIARIQELLASGWREEIDRIVAERFTDLAARMAEECEAAVRTRVAAEMSAALPAAREASRRQFSEELNLAVRGLAEAAGVDQWAAALLESTAAFRQRAAVFTLTGREMKAAAVRGVPDEAAVARLLAAGIALADAPAFAQAAETRETVVAMRSEGELSAAVADALGAVGDAHAHLVPLCGRQRVLGVVYADGDAEHLDANAIETLTAIGAAALDALLARSLSRPGALVALSSLDTGMAPAAPAWDAMSKPDQELHLRAQRFARVQVAEMRLYKSRQVRGGRADRNLYGALKEEIDSSREAFRRQFIAATPTMADYLHQELLRSLSNDDPSLLGPDYPGPLA